MTRKNRANMANAEIKHQRKIHENEMMINDMKNESDMKDQNVRARLSIRSTRVT